MVARVHCYITHVQNGETRFLAVGELMKEHKVIETHNAIVVTENSSGPNSQKVVVFSTKDILQNVGLVRYDKNRRHTYKVVWPYMKYYEGPGANLEVGKSTYG